MNAPLKFVDFDDVDERAETEASERDCVPLSTFSRPPWPSSSAEHISPDDDWSDGAHEGNDGWANGRGQI